MHYLTNNYLHVTIMLEVFKYSNLTKELENEIAVNNLLRGWFI